MKMNNQLKQAMISSGAYKVKTCKSGRTQAAKVVSIVKSKAKVKFKSKPVINRRVGGIHKMGELQDKYQGLRQTDYKSVENNCTYNHQMTTGNVYGYDSSTHCYYLLAPDQRIHISIKNPDYGSFRPYQDNYIHGKEVERMAKVGVRLRRIPSTDNKQSIDWEII